MPPFSFMVRVYGRCQGRCHYSLERGSKPCFGSDWDKPPSWHYSPATMPTSASSHEVSMKTLFILVLMLITLSLNASETHTVPLDIRSYFNKIGCSEILDYYSDSRVLDKPYLYGAVSASSGANVINDYSFLAWCKSNDVVGNGQYILVGQLEGHEWPGGCTFPVRGFDYPGGIEIKRMRINLSQFNSILRRNVGNGFSFGPVIRNEQDGLVSEIFCQRGEWVIRNID